MHFSSGPPSGSRVDQVVRPASGATALCCLESSRFSGRPSQLQTVLRAALPSTGVLGVARAADSIQDESHMCGCRAQSVVSGSNLVQCGIACSQWAHPVCRLLLASGSNNAAAGSTHQRALQRSSWMQQTHLFGVFVALARFSNICVIDGRVPTALVWSSACIVSRYP